MMLHHALHLQSLRTCQQEVCLTLRLPRSSDNLALHHMDSSQDLGIRISVTSTPGHTHQPLVTVAGSISYCSQVACIMPGSLRDNILFGAALDPGRYAAAVEAACLTRDLALLPAGDATELGEGGFNLSGETQQWGDPVSVCLCAYWGSRCTRTGRVAARVGLPSMWDWKVAMASSG
jgi:hypothetical protein